MNFTIDGMSATATYFQTFAFAFFLFTVALHIIFAAAVFVDASKRDTKLVGPVLWAAATLIIGPFFVVAYWAVNRLAVIEELRTLYSQKTELTNEEKIQRHREELNKRRSQS